MTSQMQRTAWFGVALAWAVLSGAPAVADDSELFIGTSNAAGVQPNILLIIDNSISMDELVRTQEPFDGNLTYPPGGTGCDANRVYYRIGSGSIPDCDTNRWFDLSALKCNRALQAFITAGVYTDLMGQYDTTNNSSGKRWEAFSTSRRNAAVECEDDAGVHGNGVDTANLYARNGSTNNGYWGTFAQRITWGVTPLDTQTVTLYSGNYMNWTYGPRFDRTRLEVVKEVANDLLDTVNGVNVGLMAFNELENFTVGSQGGHVIHAMSDIDTARATLQSDINALTPEAATPLSETLYEAALYMKGGAVDYGNPDSVSGSRKSAATTEYESPIDYACQKNYIVLLTDGEPTFDTDADTKIRGLTDLVGGTFNSLVGASCDTETYPAGFNPSGGNCLDDLAEFLHDGDFSTENEQQNITTYTVGFTVNLPVLADTASRGGGQYFTADDTASLSGSLQQIVTSILASNTTFTAPTVAVNTFNRTQTLSDLFISVFRPSSRMHWPGNLKKFRLDASTGQIVDRNGRPAIDPDTGFFAASAQDYWSASIDGEDVEKGGAANIIPTPANRVVYTYTGTNNALTATSNRVTATNAAVTDAMLGTGGAGDPTRAQVISFINGTDLPDTDQDNNVTEPRTQLGDPLHSQPVSMVYGPGLRQGLIFSATNDGFLHAFDLETGVERWSFIPPDFLDDQMHLYNDDAMSVKHYGIDGDLTMQIVADSDSVIESGEKVYLFFGMRRGGDFYYGLDVSDPSAPVLLWRKDGTTLPGLGQSWSTPIPTRVNVAGATQNTEKLALVIGGGYEPDQDLDTASTDIIGNNLYIIDSVTGALLWHGGKTGTHKSWATAGRSMDYSIPSDVRVIDLDGNGYVDRMYVGDMGGQLWRFDVTNGNAAASLVTGGVIAQLGAAPSATPTLANTRRFYNAPDFAIINSSGYDFVHIGIGSGHRGHPLSTAARDRFYSVRDYKFAAMTQTQFDALTIITNASLTSVTTASTSVPQGTSPGWRIDLSNGGTWIGEKVMAEGRTFDNEVVFTTFRPGSSGLSCVPQLGTNRIYRMSVYNGAPVMNLDGSADPTTLTLTDLYIENEGAPLPTPQFVFLDTDRDHDGVPDAEDDSDSDGIPDDQDADFDGDGVVDANADMDNDGIPNTTDDDMDGDGTLNSADTDANGNGIPDLPNEDPDGDGVPNFYLMALTSPGQMLVGTIALPAGYENTPVRTYWRQRNAAQ